MSEVLLEYSLQDTFKLIKQNIVYALTQWVKILLAFIAFLLGGFIYSYFLKPNYIARTTFVSETSSNDKLGGYGAIAAQFGFDIGPSGGGAFEGDNLAEVFMSRNLVVMTLLSPVNSNDSSKLLIDEYIENHQIANKLNKKINFKNVLKTGPNFNRTEDSILTRIYLTIVKDKLIVEKPDKKLNFVAIEFNDVNEIFAQKFSNLLVSNVINYYTKYKVQKISKNIDILQRQADSVKAALFGSISNVAITLDLNVNPLKQIVKTKSQKENVDLTIGQTVLPEILKQLEISKIALRKETPLIQIIDVPVLPLKKTTQDKRVIVILVALIGTALYVLLLLFTKPPTK